MGYQLEIKDDILVLKTTSFRAEKGSFLHEGIFNREFTSSLAAGAALILAAFLLRGHAQIAGIYFIAGAFIFAGLFLFFRRYIFQEPVLETVFDKGRKIITVSIKRICCGRAQTYPLDELRDITLNLVTLQPENIDGIKIVEKIALQHGTVIPGFGKRQDYYTVRLNFRDEEITVFSSKEKQSAEDVAAELNKYIDDRKA